MELSGDVFTFAQNPVQLQRNNCGRGSDGPALSSPTQTESEHSFLVFGAVCYVRLDT
jgi:hypothetical protein